MQARGIVSLGLAVLLTLLVLVLGMEGLGPLPPLGSAFNPGTGVFTLAEGARLPHSETLTAPGLEKPVTVTFNRQGAVFVQAATTHDLWWSQGYLEARFRLFEMDLLRREGEGLLSQVVGRAALPSDRFELELGLLRTARAEWFQMRRGSPVREALLAFTAGVNAMIRRDERHDTLPVMFKLLGYRPAAWTPIDTLVIQGIMTQDLDYTTAPVEYALLARSLGWKRTMAWFPVLPLNPQHPYDPGPYRKESPAPIEPQTLVQTRQALMGGIPSGAVVLAAGPDDPAAAAGPAPFAKLTLRGGPEARALSSLLSLIRRVPKTAVHQFPDSNNWAVSGQKTASREAMLAGDPHLYQTLPAIWYQFGGKAPGLDFSGVSIPGIPMVVIGMNQNIAWSLTNVQNQATFYYREKTSPQHPGQYFWRGAWRRERVVRYEIPVKGGAFQALTVRLTVHGPILTQAGETLAMDWIGALPSGDLEAVYGILHASRWTQFRNALRTWHAPSQNFVYADRHGHIGLISAGYYPLVAHGQPWMPMTGTGADDIVGTVPYNAIPQAYDPKGGLVFSANQREVGASYPYYIGTSMDFFDPGFRADQIYSTLAHAHDLTRASFAALQNNVHDVLATLLVPPLLKALRTVPLTPQERALARLLAAWHGQMTVRSQAATIWWYFLGQYVQATFGPWWKADRVPVGLDPSLALQAGSEVSVPLIEDLEVWTLHDPSNPSFTPPGAARRTAPTVMVAAFRAAVAELARKLGPNPTRWDWGRVHFREFPSLAQIPALGYGPRPSSGDPFTVNAADGGLVATHGPSWRMIVTWTRTSHAWPLAEGVYPGGQSENPLSPWYENEIAAWWHGRYYPIQSFAEMSASPGTVTWRLVP